MRRSVRSTPSAPPRSRSSPSWARISSSSTRWSPMRSPAGTWTARTPMSPGSRPWRPTTSSVSESRPPIQLGRHREAVRRQRHPLPPYAPPTTGKDHGDHFNAPTPGFQGPGAVRGRARTEGGLAHGAVPPGRPLHPLRLHRPVLPAVPGHRAVPHTVHLIRLPARLGSDPGEGRLLGSGEIRGRAVIRQLYIYVSSHIFLI